MALKKRKLWQWGMVLVTIGICLWVLRQWCLLLLFLGLVYYKKQWLLAWWKKLCACCVTMAWYWGAKWKSLLGYCVHGLAAVMCAVAVYIYKHKWASSYLLLLAWCCIHNKLLAIIALLLLGLLFGLRMLYRLGRRFPRQALACCILAFFVGRFFIAAIGYHTYSFFFNPSYLPEIFIRQVQNFVKPELAPYLQPPQSIDISLSSTKITISEWELPDIYRKTLAKFPKIVVHWRNLFFSPQISRIEIFQPQFTLHCNERGVFNYAILRTDEAPSANTQISLPELKVHNGRISLEVSALPNSHHLFFGDEIHFALDSEEENRYRISAQLSSNFTKKLRVSGTYSPFEEGLALRFRPITVSLFSLNPIIEYLDLKEKIHVDGQVILEEVAINGLSKSHPQLTVSNKIRLVNGYCSWEDTLFQLPELAGKLYFVDGNLQRISASARLGNGSLSIQEGKVTSQGELYLPFSLANFQLDRKLVSIISRFTSFPLHKYWDQSAPSGNVNIFGTLMRSLAGKWDWKARMQIIDAAFCYRQLQCKDLNLLLECVPKSLKICHGRWQLKNSKFIIAPGATCDLQNFPPHISNLQISFSRFRVDRELWRQFPEADEVWEFLLPEGFVDGQIYIDGNPLKNLPVADVQCYQFNACLEEVPLPTKQVFGKLTFRDGCLYLQNIRGKTISDSPFTVNGRVWLLEKPHEIAFDIYVHTEEVPLDQALYYTFGSQQEDWHSDIQDVWDSLHLVGGTVQVDAHIVRPRKSPHPPNFDVKVRGRGINANYVEFPYPITDVSGEVVAERGAIKFTGIKARKQQGRLQVSGQIYPQDQGLEVRIAVVGRDIPIDNDLKNALGEEYQRVWEDFSPQGQLDITVKLNKKAHLPKVQWTSNVNLNNVSACYRQFPYRVEQICGKLRLAPNTFFLDNLQGSRQGGIVTVNGSIKPQLIKIKIAGKNIPIDRNLQGEITPEIQKIWNQFDLTGKLHLQVALQKRPEHDWQWRTWLQFQQLQGACLLLPYRFENIAGKVFISPAGFRIRDCHAKNPDGAQVDIRGGHANGKLHLYVNGRNIPVNRKLYRILETENQEIWNLFSPQGRIDVKWAMTSKGLQQKQRLQIIPRDLAISYGKFPYRIENIRVSKNTPTSGICIDEAETTFQHLSGRHGHAQFAISGAIAAITSKKQRFDLQIRAHNLTIDREICYAIGNYFPTIGDNLQPHGAIEKLHLEVSNISSNEAYLQYKVIADNLVANMKQDSFIEKLAGNFQVHGFAYNDRYQAQGKITQGEVVINKLRFDNLESPIKFYNNYLSLTPIKGDFYGGQLAGWLIFDTSNYSAYKGLVSVSNTQLKPIVLALSENDAPQQETGIEGQLNCEVSFQGSTHSNDSLTGKGWLQVADGTIWQFPLLLAIFDVFSLPDYPAFREGEMHFSISKSKYNIRSLQLHSSLLSISGQGSIGFDDTLNLLLLTHFAPLYIPRIPLVDHVLEHIKQRLFALQVNGTIQEPTIELKQWQNIRKIIEKPR